MKYLKNFQLFESVDLLVKDIDKYKPMIKLMADLLDLHLDPNYAVHDDSEPFRYIYSILLKFENFFNNRNLKIGNIKYSLNAPGDNELNKLKELNKVYIGHGEDISLNPELYFEDIKHIDWLLYQVEAGNYHIKIEPSFVSWSKNYKDLWTPNKKDLQAQEVIKSFKENLNNLELFYTKFGKFNKPKFTIEDIEDMMLEFIDSRSISSPHTYLDYRFRHVQQGAERTGEFKHLSSVDSGNELFYLVTFDISLEDDDYTKNDKYVKDLMGSILNRLDRNFKLLHKEVNSQYQDWDTKEWKSHITLRLIEK